QEHFTIERTISGFDSIAQIIRQGYVMVMGTVGKMVSHSKRCQRARNLGPARVVAAGHEACGLVGSGHATIIAHIVFWCQLQHCTAPLGWDAPRVAAGWGRRGSAPLG